MFFEALVISFAILALLKPDNLQDSFNTKLGMTDAQYTAAADAGTYTNFAKDSAGYGLAQWTYYTRKEALLSYIKGKGKSIADLTSQLEFLLKELESYPAVLSTLKNAKSVKEASDAVLTGFEKPADQGDSVKTKRAEYGQAYFDKYAGGTSTVDNGSFKVKVSISNLNIRKGPGTGYAKTDKFTGKGVFTITEVKTGTGSSSGWGKLKSGAGWISLDYCQKV